MASDKMKELHERLEKIRNGDPHYFAKFYSQPEQIVRICYNSMRIDCPGYHKTEEELAEDVRRLRDEKANRGEPGV